MGECLLKQKFASGGGGRLPEGFQEVAYIQSSSSGHQWIDSNYVLTSNNAKIGAVFMIDYFSGTWYYPTPIGYAQQVSPYYNRLYIQGYKYYSSDYLYAIAGNMGSNSQITASTGVKYTVDATATASSLISTINGVSNTYSGTFSCASNTYKYYLFVENVNGSPDSSTYLIGKIYSAYIMPNSVLVRNFVPCYCTIATTGYKGSTSVSVSAGTAGLYDLVGKRFYVNSGSGADFTCGELV